jgi:8-oxo-dGTP pyrophosphatase MutT (NUDIX family)
MSPGLEAEPKRFVRTLSRPEPEFSDWAQEYLGGLKRAEVLMAAVNPQGEIWVHQKRDNPGKVWRLPTGKLEPGEAADAALPREIMEEFGKPLPVVRPLGILEFRVAGLPEPFLSHLYLLEAGDHVPQPLDESEGLDDFRAVPPEELYRLGLRLRSLMPDDGNGLRSVFWGHFRATEQELTADLLLRPNETPPEAEDSC